MQLTSAETVLLNGKVLTVDQAFTIAEAIAIRGDRILAVGTNAEVLRRVTADARRIDLRGRTVVPGLIDAHPHMDSWRGRYPRLAGCQSIRDIQNRVANAVANARPGEWVILIQFADPETRAPQCFREGRFPNRYELDEVSPNNPVWLRGTYTTPSVVNSIALQLTGISRDTPQPKRLEPIRDWRSGDFVPSPGGVIEKDPGTGEPTGVLRDWDTLIARATTAKLWQLVPRLTLADCIANLEARVQEFNRLGITAMFEGHGLEEPVEEGTLALMQVWSRRKLTVRVQMVSNLNTYGTAAEVARRLRGYGYTAFNGAGDDWLRFAGVTITLDGPGGAFDAVQPKLSSWPGPNDEIRGGIRRVPKEKFRTVAREAARRGIRMVVKADGEEMVDWVIEVYREMEAEFGIRDRRWVMMHSKFTHPRQMSALRELGVVPTTCATFVWHHGANLARVYGDEVANRTVPIKSFLNARLSVANGSDEFPWNPFFSLWLMVTRTDGETGRQLGSTECVTREEALRIYTNNGAYLMQMEDRLGSLEEGKYADLLVLSHDYLSVQQEKIRDISPIVSMVGGQIVYSTREFEN
jgi:predicted amidohydrolase YtcJ